MCKTGKKLIREWSSSVRSANMETWQSIFYGKRKYDTHKKRCKTCGKVKK